MSVSIQLVFRSYSIIKEEGTIYYKIIIKHNKYVYSTNYKIPINAWDNRQRKVIGPKSSQINKRIDWEIQQIKRIAKLHLERDQFTGLDPIISEFEILNKQQSFSNFIQVQVQRLIDIGRLRSAEIYISTHNSFKKFYGREDIKLYEITTEIIEDYEQFLKQRLLTINTISFYMRTLKTILNKAVKLHLIKQNYSFHKIYTGIAKTQKRAICIDAIRNIKRLELSPQLEYARDIFLLSFSLRGMSMIDMAYLTHKNIKGEYLTYHRKKSGSLLNIHWEQQMQIIINKYPKDSKYLLPILKADSDNLHIYKMISKRINRHLKQIGKMVNLPIPLTMYVARHSWASIAKQKHIPISVISDALGHDSEKTTLIYLSTLDTSAVDDANLNILKALEE